MMDEFSKDEALSSLYIEVADEDTVFNDVFEIRTEIFVGELGVDQEDEFDGFDHLATHYLARWDGRPVGVARRRRMLTGDMRIERIGVLQEFRGRGIGKALVAMALRDLPHGQQVRIHSLASIVEYYQQMGFRPFGEPFEEAGLPHQEMLLVVGQS